jgi:hypothetical protein
MAGILAVSIGLGAEKLGRKISDKRLERKEKKAAEVAISPSKSACFVLICWRRSEKVSMGMLSPLPQMRRGTTR